MNIYCSYATCKNSECEKKLPKQICANMVKSSMMSGGLIQLTYDRPLTADGVCFVIWDSNILVKGKPSCFKAI